MEYPALERLEQLAKSLDGLQDRLGQRVEELREQPVELTSESGAVRVTVDHAGRVQRVEISARGMRHGAEQLGEEITTTIGQAQDQAATRLRTSMHEILGTGADDFPLD